MCECHICGAKYSNTGNLNIHIKNVHGIVKSCFTCECGRTFDNAQSLNAHYRWCLIHRNGKEVIPSRN